MVNILHKGNNNNNNNETVHTDREVTAKERYNNLKKKRNHAY